MSHFLTLVLIPGNTPKARTEFIVGGMLEPFSEHLEVEAYETECPCVGLLARKDVEEQVNAKHDIEDLRERFHNLPKKERNDETWDNMITPRLTLRQNLLDAHPLKDNPVHDCNACKGAGRRMTTYNPDSKWDWWVIGGRWNGWIYGPEQEKKFRGEVQEYTFGADDQDIKNNCRRVREIPIENPHYLPFALLTPEGEWIEKGSMGWWAMVANEISDEQWHESVKTVLSKYPDHLAVAVDCHI